MQKNTDNSVLMGHKSPPVKYYPIAVSLKYVISDYANGPAILTYSVKGVLVVVVEWT